MAHVSIDSDHNRLMVLPDSEDGFDVPMVYEKGVWRRGVYTPDELKDYFEPLNDAQKADVFIRAARAAALSLYPDQVKA
jgi:hypothetical protein